MFIAKRITYAFLAMALCSVFLWGCSEDQGKKQEKKIETTQELRGKEAAQLETERVQTPNEAARDTTPSSREANATDTQAGGKEKKKLEGC